MMFKRSTFLALLCVGLAPLCAQCIPFEVQVDLHEQNSRASVSELSRVHPHFRALSGAHSPSDVGLARRQSVDAIFARRTLTECGPVSCSTTQCGVIAGVQYFCDAPRYTCSQNETTSQGNCSRNVFLGEACTASDICVDPSLSSVFDGADRSIQCRSGICVRVQLQRAGGNCTVDEDCAARDDISVSCDAGKCSFTPDNGTCSDDDNCLKTSACTSGTCQPRKLGLPLNATCSDDSECRYDGLCIASTCVAPGSLPVGANCSGSGFLSSLYACQECLMCSDDVCTEAPPITAEMLVPAVYGDVCTDSDNCSSFDTCTCVNNSGTAQCQSGFGVAILAIFACSDELKSYSSCLHQYSANNQLTYPASEDCGLSTDKCCCGESSAYMKCVVDATGILKGFADGHQCNNPTAWPNYCSVGGTTIGNRCGGSTSGVSTTGAGGGLSGVGGSTTGAGGSVSGSGGSTTSDKGSTSGAGSSSGTSGSSTSGDGGGTSGGKTSTSGGSTQDALQSASSHPPCQHMLATVFIVTVVLMLFD